MAHHASVFAGKSVDGSSNELINDGHEGVEHYTN